MIELPFTLEIDFELQYTDRFSENVLLQILSNITEISPTPILKIHINNINQYKKIKKNTQNKNIEIQFFFYIKESPKNIPSYSDINIVIPLNTPNLYSTVKMYSNRKQSIILEPCKDLTSENLIQFEKIKIDKNLQNIYLKPYLTDIELQNFSTNKQNRSFLTCATAWFNPIVDAEGNVKCCKNHKIGNILNSNLLDLWNNISCNNFREQLIAQKSLTQCTQCLKKYNNNFLIVNNAELEYKKNKYKFEAELNHIISSPKVAIIGKQIKENQYLAQPIPIYSDEEFDKIKDITLLILE